MAICTGELIEQKQNEKSTIKSHFFQESTALPAQKVFLFFKSF
jgi:hypothetical protein